MAEKEQQKKPEPAKVEPATTTGPGVRTQPGAPEKGTNDPPSPDAPGGKVDGVKGPAI